MSIILKEGLIKDLPKEFQQVIQFKDKCLGRGAYIAGGCVVDLLRGKTPKDYDIVIIGKATSPAILKDRIKSYLPNSVVSEGGSKYDSVTKYSGGSFNVMYENMVKVKTGSYALDILIAKPCFKSIEQLLENWDFNMNMVYLDFAIGSYFIATTFKTNWLVEANLKLSGMALLRENYIKPQRMCKMLQKAADLNLNVDSETINYFLDSLNGVPLHYRKSR